MKSFLVFLSLITTLALAGPVKRALVTEWEYETVTVTVTAVKKPVPTTHSQVHQGSNTVRPTTTPQIVPKPVPTTTPQVVASPAPSPPMDDPTSGIDYSKLSDYAKPILLQHNFHRKNHSVSDLEWDEGLVDVAKQIAETCVYAHSRAFGDGDYGQNIGAGSPPEDVPKLITNSMYNGEINFYPGYNGEPSMTDFETWGHFSQIVWKDTKSVGCYTAKCGKLQNVGANVSPYFTVCNYKPSGNYGGQFGKNVLAPLGQKSIVV